MNSRELTKRIALGSAVVLACAATALAQDARPKSLPDPQLPAPVETIPEQIYPCNPGNYEPGLGAVPDVPAAIDCGEVIVPPQGVDADIAIPPPEPGTGTMLVIPPSAIDETKP